MSVLRVQLSVVTDVRTLQEVTSASVLKGGLVLEMTNAHVLVSIILCMCLGLEEVMLMDYANYVHMNIEVEVHNFHTYVLNSSSYIHHDICLLCRF